MTEILTLVVVALLGGMVGYRIADHIHQSVIADLLDRAGVTPEKMEQIMQDLQREMEPESKTLKEFPDLEITIEQHSNTLYAFRKDTAEFLAQGATRDELIEMISKKVSNVTLIIAEADGAALIKENPTA
jgi:tetrahydromethanopterin S-methyltransferase subunit B